MIGNIPNYGCNCGRKERCFYCGVDFCGKRFGVEIYDVNEGEKVSHCGYCKIKFRYNR